MACYSCSVKVLLLVTLAFLALMIIVIVVAFVGVPAIIVSQVNKEVHLEKGTDQWNRFINLPVPFDIQVYIYHIKNAEDVKNGSLPDVEERGPYHYIESINKTIYDINKQEDSVTYSQIKNIVFNQEKSGNLTEDDPVTILNPAMTVIAQISSPVELLATVGCLDKIFPPEYNDIIITLDIKTAVIKGFTFASEDMNPGPACSVVRHAIIKKASKMKNIEVVRDPNDSDHVLELRFSFLQFRLRGVSQDGVYTVNRGIHDIKQLGNIMRWNESETLPFWGQINSINNDTCKKVRGTDATMYPPRIKKGDYLEIFSPDICRVVRIDYNGTGTYKGIDGYRFVPNENTLKSATVNPENDCYCTKSVSDQTGSPSCWLDGVVDVMPCFNAPVLLSWPHFLYADEYRNGFTGIGPADPEIHQTYLLVEPNTGTPLEGKKRIQINFVMRPIKFMPLAENFPKTVIPSIWIDEGVSLTDKLINELKDKYFDKMKLASGIKYALIALSAAAFCVSTVFLVRKKIAVSKSHSS